MPTPAKHPVPAAALELLLERGFDATSVDELAAAAGVSRSTFFRRYGSKEDMVFSDQEDRIRAAEQALERGAGSGSDALVPAALAVLDHHTAHPRLSQLRHELLHRVPALRDRELISTHRFERLFRRYLLADASNQGPLPDARRTSAVALAAAVVAVHNDYLRAWLRSPSREVRPRLEAALRELVQRHRSSQDGAADATGPTIVVVTAADQSPESVAAAVERTLRERG